MARQKKATVDYFPHVTEHGKTIFILESKWGNDGYAAWFKLLERLGASDGHYIDCRDPATWAYLVAYIKVPDGVLMDILNFLAKVSAIDKELWSVRVIYSDNFVSGITDAYRKRINTLPSREKVLELTNIVLEVNPAEDCTQKAPIGQKNEQTDGRSTEREREREREIKAAALTEVKITDSEPQSGDQTAAAAFENPMPLSECRKLYRTSFGTINESSPIVTVLQDICRLYPPERIREAFAAAAVTGAKSLNWVRKRLEDPGGNQQPKIDTSMFQAIIDEERRSRAQAAV